MSAFLYFGLLILIVMIGFAVFRRPMYEVILASFVILTAITGNIAHILTYMFSAANTYLLYTIAAFICFSIYFERTGIISDMINIIVALVGRFSGGRAMWPCWPARPWGPSPEPARAMRRPSA